jgi:hypothetical protein
MQIAIAVIERQGRGFGAARVSGNATDDSPARLVLLRRHADMADEISDIDARTDAERGAEMIASILEGVESGAGVDNLAAVLDQAQEALRASGAYYSVLIAIVTTRRVTAGGIGNVTMRRWTPDRNDAVLDPTITRAGGTHILSGAPGLGYDRGHIQTADVVFDTTDRMLVGVEVDLRGVRPICGDEPPAEVLRRVLEDMTFERSSVVGVITR